MSEANMYQTLLKQVAEFPWEESLGSHCIHKDNLNPEQLRIIANLQQQADNDVCVKGQGYWGNHYIAAGELEEAIIRARKDKILSKQQAVIDKQTALAGSAGYASLSDYVYNTISGWKIHGDQFYLSHSELTEEQENILDALAYQGSNLSKGDGYLRNNYVAKGDMHERLYKKHLIDLAAKIDGWQKIDGKTSVETIEMSKANFDILHELENRYPTNKLVELDDSKGRYIAGEELAREIHYRSFGHSPNPKAVAGNPVVNVDFVAKQRI